MVETDYLLPGTQTLQQLFHNGSIEALAFISPVDADGFGLLLYGNGQCQVDQHGILFQNTAAGRELTGICLIVIGRRGNLIAQLIAVFLEKESISSRMAGEIFCIK